MRRSATGYKTWAKIFLALLLASTACLGQSTPSKAPIELDGIDLATLKVLDRVVRLFGAESQHIWPGYDLSRRPLIVYRPGKWTLLLNARQEVEGFSALPTRWPEMPYARYHPGQFLDLVGQLEFDIPVGSSKAAAVAASETYMKGASDSAHLFAFIVHENFHQFQNDSFTAADQLSEERYPITDRENTALAYIEMEILRDALNAAQSGNDARVRELLRQFVAVRSTRWSRNPFVKSFESAEERVEGTAKYVEAKALDLVQQNFGRAEAQDRASGGYAQGANPQYLLSEFSSRSTGGTVAPVDVPRNRLYPVGAAMGMLLDALGADWKKPMAADANASFVGLLSAALHIDQSNLSTELMAAKKQYGYGEAVKAADDLIRQHEDGFQAELREFESQPGYRVQIRLSSDKLQRSRTSSAKKWTIDDGARTICKRYEVYTLRSTYGSLNLREVGVLEEQDWAAHTRTVVFFVPTVPSVWLEGMKLETLPERPTPFRSLKFVADVAQFQTDKPGQIRAGGRSITIDLLPSVSPEAQR